MTTKAICFGEILWDLLPSGKVAGGAPMNVAVQLNNLGIPTQMISRIGADDLGQALLEFLQSNTLDTSLVQIDTQYATGTVAVTLDEKGSPSYEIIQPVAWDFIETNSNIEELIEQAEVFICGSLVARNEQSRTTLFQLLKKSKKNVIDINLRAPFYSQRLIEELLMHAHIVKMNDEELILVSEWWNLHQLEEQAQLQNIIDRFELEGIILTKGKDGASFCDNSTIIHQKGFPIQVQDTVGSGDAFLAGFLSQYLSGKSSEDCLKFACATGALLATKKGGTAKIDKNIVEKIISLS